MKKLVTLTAALITAILLLHFQTFARSGDRQDITIVLPTESVAAILQDMLPCQFDFGKKFTGSFMAQSIDNLEIVKDKITFSSYIIGEDVEYSTKIVNKLIKVAVGDVRLRNNWEALLRYDRNKKLLFVTPHIRGVIDKDNVNQGGMLLHALLKGLSGIEYPVKISELKPIKTTLSKRDLFINVDITDIYAESGKLVVTMKPSAKYGEVSGPESQ